MWHAASVKAAPKPRMGCWLPVPRRVMVSPLAARPALCQVNEPAGENRCSPAVRCTVTGPLDACSPGNLGVEANTFMNGRLAAEAAVIARKLRRVGFDIGALRLGMTPNTVGSIATSFLAAQELRTSLLASRMSG